MPDPDYDDWVELFRLWSTATQERLAEEERRGWKTVWDRLAEEGGVEPKK